MSCEAESNPESLSSQELGSLGVCLVDGDVQQRSRERKARRSALTLSILLQGAALAFLLLIPLFGTAERISTRSVVPVPPYGHPARNPSIGDTSARNGPAPREGHFVIFPFPTHRVIRAPVDGAPVPPEEIGPAGASTPEGPNCPWCVNIGEPSKGPLPPQPEVAARGKPALLKMTKVDPALLIRRVEPVYPELPKQIHKEGRVELRAIIATDGTIQSLHVVSGDPLFINSAIEGVRLWRYKPTYLNGQPVEIDTFITIFYKLEH